MENNSEICHKSYILLFLKYLLVEMNQLLIFLRAFFRDFLINCRTILNQSDEAILFFKVRKNKVGIWTHISQKIEPSKGNCSTREFCEF